MTPPNVPSYLTNESEALARALSLEEQIISAAEGALAGFLERVVADARDGSILRGTVVGYWEAALTSALAHPTFASIRDEFLAAVFEEEFADDVAAAAQMALEHASVISATQGELDDLLNRLFQRPAPGLIASLSERVDRWLTRRIQRYLRIRMAESGGDDLARDDLEGPLYEIPTTPSERSVRSEEWLEDDRPGEINWRARMRRDIRTAYTRVFGKNMLRLLEQYGFPEKMWVTRLDPKVRPTHVHAHGQTVALYETFRVGVASLMYPGDPTGPKGEIINCRCVIVGRGAPTAL